MNRKGQEFTKQGAVILTVFLLIMMSYIIYLMMLQPWERKALLTNEATITINVQDCGTGYPINNASVQVYTSEGQFIKEEKTTNGIVQYKSYPDCFRIASNFGETLYDNVCVGSGENRTVNFCYNYPQANPRIIYYTDYVGFIGGTSGQKLTSKEFGNVIMSYPLSNITLNYPSYFIYSNLLWSEGMKLVIDKINANFTKALTLKFTMESIRGDPTIRVYANKQLITEQQSSTGEIITSVIPQQSLNETITLEIKCDFNGYLFWTSQDCNLTDIQVIQEFYTPKKTSQEFIFDTTTAERNASNIELDFISTSIAASGLNASINDELVFDSDSLLAQAYSATIPIEKISLNSTGNKLRFEAKPGAEFWLRGVNLYFTAPINPKTNEMIAFSIPSQELNTLNNVLISYFVNNLYINTELLIKVNNNNYVQKIDKSGWNTISIAKTDVATENLLNMTARTGRLEITQLKITWE